MWFENSINEYKLFVKERHDENWGQSQTSITLPQQRGMTCPAST